MAKATGSDRKTGKRLTSPFRISLDSSKGLASTALKVIAKPAEKIFGLQSLDRMYQRLPKDMPPVQFARTALDSLSVSLSVDEEELSHIPTEGPAIVVANHPFGAIEGVVLASLLGAVREDFQIMANHLLGRIPEMRPLLLEVDPFKRTDSVKRNIASMKRAIRYVKDEGGLLAVFPSGEVSHRKWKRWWVTDPQWSHSVAGLVRRTEAPVVPIHFQGANNWFFQTAGLVHKRLRTALLPRQLLNKRSKTVVVKVGSLIKPERMAGIIDNKELIEYLRLRTYILAENPSPMAEVPTRPKKSSKARTRPIVAPQSHKRLLEAVRALPPEAKLVSMKGYELYGASADEIPDLMQEIGRLREVTFREVGEGTGKSLDIDRFDKYYQHLFIWHKEAKEIVGAYRLGEADKILATRGVKGMYTRTLYKYKKNLLEQLNPALELGRSFVRPRYQREYMPLHLLWMGIGQFIVRQPHYRILFGPVSVSATYHPSSVRLIVDYLRRHTFANDFAPMLKANSPYKAKKKINWNANITGRILSDLDEISSMVAKIETDGKGLPILLKHYLRLGGQVLGFNVDKNFSAALDALICVDLTQCTERVLGRYFGKKEAADFLRRHNAKED